MNTTENTTVSATATRTNAQLAEIVNGFPARSAWAKGVKAYALEMIESAEVELANAASLPLTLLNGASDWNAYSDGGCALIYDADICERLCSPSEIKRTRNGERQPNASESWLDCQARACSQAARMIARAVKS